MSEGDAESHSHGGHSHGGHSHGTTKPLREERRPPRDDVEEIVPGILRIQLPISLPGLGHVNCYAMEDARGVTLVDPGLPGPRTTLALRKQLKSVGLALRDVHTVVVTHSHPDHFGQAGVLRQRSGAEVITHRNFRTFLDPESEDDDFDLDVGVTSSDRTAELADRSKAMVAAARNTPQRHGPLSSQTPWGGSPYMLPRSRQLKYKVMQFTAGRLVATPSPTKRVVDADVLQLGNRDWVAVHTPGHTVDHLCLYDPNDGIMISGDHVLPTITPHISGMGETSDPLGEFFSSLDRMKTFDQVSTVLPAHGLEFNDLGARAMDIKEHHFERLDTLREASDELGQGTVEQYMRSLFAERSWGAMAESETYAHLEHLRLAGEAEADESGAELRYSFG